MARTMLVRYLLIDLAYRGQADCCGGRQGVLNFFEDAKVPRAGLLANSTDRALGVRVRSFCVRTTSRAGWRRLIDFRFKILQN